MFYCLYRITVLKINTSLLSAFHNNHYCNNQDYQVLRSVHSFCMFAFQIESFPSHPSDNPELRRSRLDKVTRPPPPTSINCSRVQDPVTGAITVSVMFMYPLEVPILQATRLLRVRPFFVIGHDTRTGLGIGITRAVPSRNVSTNVSSEYGYRLLHYICMLLISRP